MNRYASASFISVALQYTYSIDISEFALNELGLVSEQLVTAVWS